MNKVNVLFSNDANKRADHLVLLALLAARGFKHCSRASIASSSRFRSRQRQCIYLIPITCARSLPRSPSDQRLPRSPSGATAAFGANRDRRPRSDVCSGAWRLVHEHGNGSGRARRHQRRARVPAARRSAAVGSERPGAGPPLYRSLQQARAALPFITGK